MMKKQRKYQALYDCLYKYPEMDLGILSLSPVGIPRIEGRFTGSEKQTDLSLWDGENLIACDNMMPILAALALDVIELPKPDENILVMPAFEYDKLPYKDEMPSPTLYLGEENDVFDGVPNMFYPDRFIYKGKLPHWMERIEAIQRFSFQAGYMISESGVLVPNVRLGVKSNWNVDPSYKQVKAFLDGLGEIAGIGTLPDLTEEIDAYCQWRQNMLIDVSLEEAQRESIPDVEELEAIFERFYELGNIWVNECERERCALIVKQHELEDPQIIATLLRGFSSHLSGFESALDAWKSGVPLEDIYA